MRAGAFFAACLLIACGGDDPPPAPPVSWTCPTGWVASTYGGCGPAVLLCVDDGAAATGACDGVDLSVPDPTSGFYRTADGSPAGAWTGAVPDADWLPEAGIPSCADGWARDADATCDPMLRTDCPAGAEPLPGGRCTATGEDTCASGPFADVSAESGGDRVVHLRAGADDASADGSAALPYGSIDAALAALPMGGWLLVADGELSGRITIPFGRTLHVVGTCPGRVTLRAPDARTSLVTAPGGTVDLRGLTLAGGDTVVWVTSGGHASLRSVIVSEGVGRGIEADGAGTTLDAEDVVVQRSSEVTNASGAVWGQGGSTITLRHVVLKDNAETGLVAYDGSSLHVTDSVVRETRRQGTTGVWGNGAWAQMGSTITAERVVFASNPAELVSRDPGTTVELTDCIVRDVRPLPGDPVRAGITSEAGGVIGARRTLIEDVEGSAAIAGAGGRVFLEASHVRLRELERAMGSGVSAVGIDGVAAEAELTGVIVEGTTFGLLAAGAGTITGQRVIVRDVALVGAAAGRDSTMVLEDAVIEDMALDDEGNGIAVAVDVASSATLRRLRIDRALGASVVVSGESRLAIEDARVESTQQNGAGIALGIEINQGSSATISRAWFGDHGHLALIATGDGSMIEVSDTRITATGGTTAPIGHALVAGYGGRVVGRRLWIDDATELGVATFEAGAALDLEDVVVDGVVPSPRGFGIGAAAFGGSITATRLALADTHGSALAAVPYRDPTGGGAVRFATVGVTDLWVRRVRTSTIQFGADHITPAGRAVAYGIHSGDGCSAGVTRFVVAEGGYGLVASGGSMDLIAGVVAGQVDAAGATDPAPPNPAFQTDQLDYRGNAIDDVVAAPEDLPSAASLPAPTRICVEPPCE